MLSNYSWGDFLFAMATLIAIYYVIIAVLYYRKEITNVFTGKIKIRYKRNSEAHEGDEPGQTDNGGVELEGFEELREVLGNLKSSVLEQAGKQATKQQLLQQLAQRLANYGGLRRPAFRTAVNHYIMQHAKDICGIMFSEGELDEQWRTLPR